MHYFKYGIFGFVVLAMASACKHVGNRSDLSVVRGVEADIAFVKKAKIGNKSCSIVFVHPKVGISAAHCFGAEARAAVVKDELGIKRKSVKVVENPEYDPKDMSLVGAAGDVVAVEFAVPMVDESLPGFVRSSSAGREVTIAGFGVRSLRARDDFCYVSQVEGRCQLESVTIGRGEYERRVVARQDKGRDSCVVQFEKQGEFAADECRSGFKTSLYETQVSDRLLAGKNVLDSDRVGVAVLTGNTQIGEDGENVVPGHRDSGGALLIEDEYEESGWLLAGIVSRGSYEDVAIENVELEASFASFGSGDNLEWLKRANIVHGWNIESLDVSRNRHQNASLSLGGSCSCGPEDVQENGRDLLFCVLRGSEGFLDFTNRTRANDRSCSSDCATLRQKNKQACGE